MFLTSFRGLASLANMVKQDEPNGGRVKSVAAICVALCIANHSLLASWSWARQVVVLNKQWKMQLEQVKESPLRLCTPMVHNETE